MTDAAAQREGPRSRQAPQAGRDAALNGAVTPGPQPAASGPHPGQGPVARPWLGLPAVRVQAGERKVRAPRAERRSTTTVRHNPVFCFLFGFALALHR